MSRNQRLRVVDEECSSVLLIEAVDPDDDCTVTNRIEAGAQGSMRWLWLVKKLLAGSGYRMVRR